MRIPGELGSAAAQAACVPLPSVDGAARVVAIHGNVAWLEAERPSACAACASAPLCAGVAPTSSDGMPADVRARRFSVARSGFTSPLQVGERVVVHVPAGGFVEAALTAYAVPALALVVAGGFAEAAGASEATVLAAMAGGLALGLALTRALAGRSGVAARIAPRVLRRSAAVAGTALSENAR